MSETLFEVEEDIQIRNIVNQKYPHLILPSIPSSISIRGYEAGIYYLLKDMGYLVYREPLIQGFDFVPDFFLVQKIHQEYDFHLLEVTLMREDGFGKKKLGSHTLERKKRQLEKLNQCGIPFWIWYKEDIVTINTIYDANIL